jgi:hypothetical protein
VIFAANLPDFRNPEPTGSAKDRRGCSSFLQKNSLANGKASNVLKTSGALYSGKLGCDLQTADS